MVHIDRRGERVREHRQPGVNSTKETRPGAGTRYPPNRPRRSSTPTCAASPSVTPLDQRHSRREALQRLASSPKRKSHPRRPVDGSNSALNCVTHPVDSPCKSVPTSTEQGGR
jgi:hypothetical protein